MINLNLFSGHGVGSSLAPRGSPSSEQTQEIKNKKVARSKTKDPKSDTADTDTDTASHNALRPKEREN